MAKTKRAKPKPTRRDTRRRIEQLAKNPLCEANALSAVHDVPMDEVAKSVGIESKFGQSRFAITRGLTFERALLREEAASLRDALHKARVLPSVEADFVDLRIRLSGGPLKTLDEAYAKTLALFERVASRRIEEPLVVAGPALEVPGKAILPGGMVALDVLVLQAREHGVLAQIGEVKIYPDRGGHTDASQLSTARAQAGLYLYLLRDLLARRGWADAIEASNEGFLVLSRAGQNTPKVRAPEDLRWQARRAEVAIERLLAAAKVTLDEKRRLTVVADAPKHYCEGCVAFCDLADRCHDEALAAGEAVALGAEVARFLGAIPLPRAVALLSGAAPASLTEEDLVHRMGDAR
jgi:hypothetical protein